MTQAAFSFGFNANTFPTFDDTNFSLPDPNATFDFSNMDFEMPREFEGFNWSLVENIRHAPARGLDVLGRFMIGDVASRTFVPPPFIGDDDDSLYGQQAFAPMVTNMPDPPMMLRSNAPIHPARPYNMAHHLLTRGKARNGRIASQVGPSQVKTSKHHTSTFKKPRKIKDSKKAAFVNSTPEDSSKIVTAVAPSGRMKRKVQHEQINQPCAEDQSSRMTSQVGSVSTKDAPVVPKRRKLVEVSSNIKVRDEKPSETIVNLSFPCTICGNRYKRKSWLVKHTLENYCEKMCVGRHINYEEEEAVAINDAPIVDGDRWVLNALSKS